MGIYTAIVRELVHAGISGEELIAALERVEAHALPAVDTTAERRRSADRERKKEERERLRKSADSADTVEIDPPQECPQTPIETTPLVSSLRSETGSQSARAPESGCRVEFSMLFWPAYPHRVGRPKAMMAFIAARQRASLNEIMDGLARYRSSKPPDREWLNPANFLEDDRFNDDPASPATPSRSGRPKPANDAIREALLREAADELGQGGFGPGSDGRNDDFSAGPSSHSGQHFLLEATANRRPD